MLLIDDLFSAPGKLVFWVFRQIHQAAEQELNSEADRITQQLAELYNQLENGAISDQEFDAAEHSLLDRLDQIRGETETVEPEENEEPASNRAGDDGVEQIGSANEAVEHGSGR